MPLEHSNAIATITVTGLALSCYNPATKNWEIGFIQAGCHNLIATVTIPTAQDGNKIVFQVDAQHTISVECINPVFPQDPPIYRLPGAFNRQATSGFDLEDLRWVVDFDEELNHRPVQLKRPDHPIVPMYVNKPRSLYADKRRFKSDDRANLVRVADRSVVRPFTQFSEGAKADLQGDALVLRVVGPLGFSLTLPRVAGARPYDILMDNSCPEEPPAANPSSLPSDFPLYYSVIRDTSGDQFDIDVPKDGHGEGAVCNTGFLSDTDHLFPLP